ncbi:hypothetical protein [Microlunatus parietis]|uniref:Uncharacterized protein n=1 Tax=Microlunatus parietis TaxID=682979 RepID=A0A7Y9LEH5_9ACTN|nr:hypothetical protein [Microlunatus parietis]
MKTNWASGLIRKAVSGEADCSTLWGPGARTATGCIGRTRTAPN